MLKPICKESILEVYGNQNQVKATIIDGIYDEYAYGYVYVFKSTNFHRCSEHSRQWVYYGELVPIEVIKVHFRDFAHYFEYKNNTDLDPNRSI